MLHIYLFKGFLLKLHPISVQNHFMFVCMELMEIPSIYNVFKNKRFGYYLGTGGHEV